MACGNVNIKTTFLPDASSGGAWEFVGYSIDDTDYNLGGNWPAMSGSNPVVNFNNLIPGFYKLNYYKIGGCEGQVEIIIPVVHSGFAGITKSITICPGTTVNICTELGTEIGIGILDPTYQWSGSGFEHEGFMVNSVSTPLLDTYTAGTPGTYLINLTLTPVSPDGYTLMPCCVASEATLIVNVENDTLVVAIENCQIVIDSISGCTSPTFQIEKNEGSGWLDFGVQTLPYSVGGTDAAWRVKAITGCCGVITSNIVNSVGCCHESAIVIQYDSEICFIYVEQFGCGASGGGTFKWFKSCGLGPFIYQPSLDGLDIIFPQDSCKYQVQKQCNSGCISISNVVQAGCPACSGTLAVNIGTCTYTVVSGPACTSGTIQLIDTVTSVIVQSFPFTNYPFIFTVPYNGQFYAKLTCLGCPPYNGSSGTFSTCGSLPPSCTSELDLSLAGCIITATQTNCPGAEFEFISPLGLTVQIGTDNTCPVSINGTWIVKMRDCSNCLNDIVETIVVNSCDSCNCVTPILTHTPCGELAVSNCPGYTIDWEWKSISGNWSSLGNLGLTETVTNNGYYRVKFTKTNCPTVYSNQVLINCFAPPCACIPVLTLDAEVCELSYTATACSGYTLYLQRLVSGSWTDIISSPSNPYTTAIDGFYRLKATNPNCPTVYSNIEEVQCGSGGCYINAILENHESDCGKVVFSWENSSGEDVTISWAYPTLNIDDCDNAGGWVNFNPESSTISNISDTGEAIIMEHCGKCIRMIIDDGECTPVALYLVVPCCCLDNPGIDYDAESVKYIQTVKGSYGIGDQPAMFKVREGSSQLTELYVETDIHKQILPASPVFVETKEYNINIPMFSLHSVEINGLTDCLTVLKFVLGSTTYTLDLNPTTTPYLTGSFGTVTAAHLRPLNGATFNQAVTAIKTLLLNAISTQVPSITVTDIRVGTEAASKVSPVFDENILIAIKPKWNSTTWINDGLFSLVKTESLSDSIINNSSALLISPDDCLGLSGTPTSAQYRVPIDYVSECGLIDQDSPTIISYWMTTFCSGAYIFDGNLYGKLLYNSCIYGGCPLYSSINIPVAFEVWSIINSGDESNIADDITCNEYTLTVDMACPGATYLWSTGETTISIVVTTPGFYSVIINCPDGCEYDRNYNI